MRPTMSLITCLSPRIGVMDGPMSRLLTVLLATGLLATQAHAGAWRLDLSGASVDPPVAAVSTALDDEIVISLDVPDDAGCVRVLRREQKLEVHCALNAPFAADQGSLRDRDREVDGPTLQPILFQGLGTALRERLRVRFAERGYEVRFDERGIPLVLDYAYVLHGSRFGKREMEARLELADPSGSVSAQASTEGRLSAGNLAWYAPTVALAGAGAIALAAKDKRRTTAQAASTLDAVATELAAAVSASGDARATR